MPGPKKKIDKKDLRGLQGPHLVSPDGKEIFIQGYRFKRTVLPSVAEPNKETLETNEIVEELE